MIRENIKIQCDEICDMATKSHFSNAWQSLLIKWLDDLSDYFEVTISELDYICNRPVINPF